MGGASGTPCQAPPQTLKDTTSKRKSKTYNAEHSSLEMDNLGNPIHRGALQSRRGFAIGRLRHGVRWWLLTVKLFVH